MMIDPKCSRIVPVSRLHELGAIPPGYHVTVDAADADPVPLPLLARLVLLRRLRRAAGGDLVLKAGPATLELLRRCGLQRSLVTEDAAAERMLCETCSSAGTMTRCPSGDPLPAA